MGTLLDFIPIHSYQFFNLLHLFIQIFDISHQQLKVSNYYYGFNLIRFSAMADICEKEVVTEITKTKYARD